ncbi:hypothetical protein [Nonomuraea sp. NPDC050691]|uniref:hypothetical protein n=1 Tax=Nonomuraea sp. NPDC050691 TaxID=3155661 RepID=UPI0033FF3D28
MPVFTVVAAGAALVFHRSEGYRTLIAGAVVNVVLLGGAMLGCRWSSVWGCAPGGR